MDGREDYPDVGLFIAVSILAFVILGDVACAIGFLSGHPEIALTFPALFAAAVGILALVRWLNRRANPRRENPHPTLHD